MMPKVEVLVIREKVTRHTNKRGQEVVKHITDVVGPCPWKQQKEVSLNVCESCRHAAFGDNTVKCHYERDKWKTENTVGTVAYGGMSEHVLRARTIHSHYC